MTLWEELAAATSHAGGLHGFSPVQIMVMFQALSDNKNMRYTSDGQAVHREQRCVFEAGFRHNFRLSENQYGCLTNIYDRHRIGDARAAHQNSLGRRPSSQSGAAGGGLVSQSFSPDITRCCGRILRVSIISATVYGRAKRCTAWNVVKTCRHGCKRRYFFDKTIVPGVLEDGGAECLRHVYLPWEDGSVPSYIASRSGRFIVESNFLTDVAISLGLTR